MNASLRAARTSRSLLARLAVLATVAAGLTGLSSVTRTLRARRRVCQHRQPRRSRWPPPARGAPYVYGAVGPTRFDCSGLTKWAYARVGKTLQAHRPAAVRRPAHISAASRRVGDLVFFKTSHYGAVYHVGIYAGAGRIWHAPKPGDHVKLAPLWTSNVYYGRVR